MTKFKERTKLYFGQLFFLTACVGLAGAALYSNTQDTKAATGSENVIHIQNVIDDSFELEQELELYEDSQQYNEEAAIDHSSMELIEVNHLNVTRIVEGKRPLVKESALSLPLMTEFRRGWAQIELSIDAIKGFGFRADNFKVALKNYEKAHLLKKFPADERGNVYLKRAYQGFLQVLRDKPAPVIRDYTLYFLGDIGFKLWSENQDLAGAAYMVDLISTTQNAKLAKKAWMKLSAQIHFGYTGSAGDNTPADWKRFLAQLQSVSNRTTTGDFPLLSAK